ncbi:cytochrome c biogenesis protein CcmG/thiol:disulfide interchange protein DsbE [Stella humosa]|uniref:Cytochrome c biogenesis protein CcmG/thiol:disulfide interchange protein DsbE n=1 Tax=Stella humosa TaxID=94 RepID=A0A3N1L4T1_9PROT|nr:DsbE family thiol:disulfide interchange protein [Stella humosa]ROP84405.1 cytochrome c biogenesis protein CcmG/thiol:disulfide interchange protein DsbE [Stella humosa]BBK33921.1 thiol:disulfide interchange protein [Stella humosa]
MRRLLYIVPALVFALIAAYLLAGLGLDPKTLPSAMIDKPAPAFDLPALADVAPALKTADLGGEVALVNVFASWCVPCRAEHPILMRLAAEKGVPIYGINQKDKPDDARRFLAQLGNPYRRIGVDADGRASIEWGVYGVPETFVIDRAGRIRYRHVGAFGPQDLDPILAMIERLRRG